jgi:preprotein translocase subunit SecG
MGLPLAAVNFFMQIVAVVFVFVAVTLIIIVLIQKGKGGGLSAAFGGAGSSSVFGSKTGDFLTWATISIAGLFLLLAILMSRFYRPSEPQLGPDTATQAQTAPAAPAPAPVKTAVPAAPAAPAAPVAAPVNAPAGK